LRVGELDPEVGVVAAEPVGAEEPEEPPGPVVLVQTTAVGSVVTPPMRQIWAA